MPDRDLHKILKPVLSGSIQNKYMIGKGNSIKIVETMPIMQTLEATRNNQIQQFLKDKEKPAF